MVDGIYTDHPDIYYKDLAPCVKGYLDSQGIYEIASKLRSNARSLTTFKKAFFQWFDAFRLMKYLHYCRDQYYPDVSVNIAIQESTNLIGIKYTSDLIQLLARMRHNHKQWKESS